MFNNNNKNWTEQYIIYDNFIFIFEQRYFFEFNIRITNIYFLKVCKGQNNSKLWPTKTADLDLHDL